IPLPGNRQALVATSGYNKHQISVVDLEGQTVISSETVPESWFGLATTPDQSGVWWSGGGSNRLFRFGLNNGKLTREVDIEGPTATLKEASKPTQGGDVAGMRPFKSGILIDPLKRLLYSLDINAGRIDAINLADNQVVKSATC